MRALSPNLERCLRRANPNVATFVELSVPDASAVLRRAADQLLAGSDVVSITPSSSLAGTPTGAITLASTNDQIVDQYAEAGGFNIPQYDASRFMNTVAWDIDPAFGGCILRQVTVRLKWLSLFGGRPLQPDVSLQIFRATKTPGVLQRQDGTSTIESALTQVSFAAMLPEPIIIRLNDLVAASAIDSSGFADVTFDLTPYRLAIDPISRVPAAPGQPVEVPAIYFSVQTNQQAPGNFVEWRYDTTTSRNISGIGYVRELSWQNLNPDDPSVVWVASDAVNRALCIKIDVEEYDTTSAAVYELDLPALPDAASQGRIVFAAGLPRDTSATLELSTAGSGGPFTAVANGDPVNVQQLTYHARLTMNAASDQRRAPIVSALGVEFRASVDLSPESIVEHVAQDVALPFLAASIGEGRITPVRTGRRDYGDAATAIASQGPDTMLEADVYLGSRYPAVTRADWLLQTRAQVSTRQPTPTSEILTLLSITSQLKQDIPAQVETINTVHTILAATSTQLQVSPNLSGASPTGNEYDAKNYYIRVRSSTQAGVVSGTTFVISGNTDVDKLDFTSLLELPGTLAVDDIIEVHSGRYVVPAVSWVDQDPADVWLDLLTTYCGVSSDRIGLSDVGSVGRGGYPPKVTDRAPGDSTTQAKLLVTRKLTDATDASGLIDQLSFIMGGVTTEVAGQIVFRQIYPLRNASGAITVPCDPVAVIFDPRDYTALDTPTGREQRISVLSCAYGVNSASAAPEAPETATAVDVDAVNAYGLQPVAGMSAPVVPDDIATWCYNSTDGGFLLATMLAQQVVYATSTGIRPWTWTSVEQQPGLTVGDGAVVITDQYTDYDPGRRRAIKGWNAYPLTIVSVSDGGRRFRGFLQGLAGVFPLTLRGGIGSTLEKPATAALLIKIERYIPGSPVPGEVIIRVYVADPSPIAGVAISIDLTSVGVTSITPSSGTLVVPADTVTDDLATTAYVEFTIVEASAGSPQGRVNAIASRLGRLSSLPASIDIATSEAVAPGIGVFTSIAQAILDYSANTVTFSWTFTQTSGPTAYFRVFAKDSTNAWGYYADTAPGDTSFVFTSAFDLVNTLTPNLQIEFYLQAVGGVDVIAESDHSTATYGTV